MIKNDLYTKTVNILVDAYFNDTLLSQFCTACACGNLIMANNGYKRVVIKNEEYWRDKDGNYLDPLWSDVVRTSRHKNFIGIVKHEQILDWSKYTDEAKKEIESSGYPLHQFALIENAFERGYKGKDKMFNALMAVIDVLDEIHENKDPELSLSSKSKFKKQLV